MDRQMDDLAIDRLPPTRTSMIVLKTNQIVTPEYQSFPTKTKQILVKPPLKQRLAVLSKFILPFKLYEVDPFVWQLEFL